MLGGRDGDTGGCLYQGVDMSGEVGVGILRVFTRGWVYLWVVGTGHIKVSGYTMGRVNWVAIMVHSHL